MLIRRGSADCILGISASHFLCLLSPDTHQEWTDCVSCPTWTEQIVSRMAMLLPRKQKSRGWFPVSGSPPSALISSLKHPSIYSCPYSSAFCEFIWHFYSFITQSILTLYILLEKEWLVQTAHQILNQWNKRSHKNQRASLDRMCDKFSLRQIFSLQFACVP